MPSTPRSHHKPTGLAWQPSALKSGAHSGSHGQSLLQKWLYRKYSPQVRAQPVRADRRAEAVQPSRTDRIRCRNLHHNRRSRKIQNNVQRLDHLSLGHKHIRPGSLMSTRTWERRSCNGQNQRNRNFPHTVYFWRHVSAQNPPRNP